MIERICDEGALPRWDEEEEEADTEEEEGHEDLVTESRIAWIKENIEEPRRVGDKKRAQFLATANLCVPQVFRVIDIEATCSRGHVTLLDYHREQVSACGYSAISHTYGLEVYSIFDCQCACVFSSSNATIPPRCWDQPCPHMAPGEVKEQRDRVVNDILRMCDILSKAGVRYAWHDGVCIAQHDDKEVTATIQSMGWIYSTAIETIVFLHYVGKPMAPISPHGSGYDLVCRWHTRVWTLQEASLSKKRRYCVRVCTSPVCFQGFYRSCHTLKKLVRKMKEFEETVALWYRVDSSEVDVITEEKFMVDFIWKAEEVSVQLWQAAQRLKESRSSLWSVANDTLGLEDWLTRMRIWYSCLARLNAALRSTCLRFPTLGVTLAACSRRDSKHVGDRINSILILAGVKDFVAPKKFLGGDDTMEVWTIEFFKRQGQGGLSLALFSINVGIMKDDDDMQENITCTWVPLLWRPLREPDILGIGEPTKHWGIELEVSEDRRLQLKGDLVCVAMTFTLKLKGGKGVSTAEHVADEDAPYVDEDLLTDEVCVADMNSNTDRDEETLGNKCVEEEAEADLLTDEMYVDEVHSDEMYVDAVKCDGTCTDRAVFELEEEENDEEEEEEEREDEEDEETDDEELEEVAQHVKGRQSLNLELNITVEGFIDSFLVRFLDTNIIMGAAVLFPVQPSVEGNGLRIGGREIKEGDSFNAYLVAPLHYDQKAECLIVEGNLGDQVSKMGIITMFKKLNRIFQREANKAINHPAYKIMKELVIH